jgi:dienelactone hydrolase
MLAWLVAQAGVDKTRLGVGGASCGVPQATSLASRHPEIKALFVLSGPANEEGTRHIARTPGLAVLGIAGVQDVGAFEGVRQLVQASPHRASTLKSYPGPEHGVALLETHEELIPQITAWFGVQLAAPTTPPGSGVSPALK